MSPTSEPTQEHIAARTAKLAEPYNNKNVETALAIFVDTGLDFSDYGTYHPPLLLPNLLLTPINIKSHETKGVNAFNMTKAAFTISLKAIATNGNRGFTAWRWE
jgi:hypothetical protein